MSRLGDLRSALRDHLVAQEIFPEGAVIIRRSLDFWNDVSVAISATENSVVAAIDIPEGTNPDPDGPLAANLTIPITILCPASMSLDDEPLEDLWENMVRAVHGWNNDPTMHCHYDFRFQGFSDDVELGDQVEFYNARQTVFRVLQNF